jgi:hypothetical protein
MRRGKKGKEKEALVSRFMPH